MTTPQNGKPTPKPKGPTPLPLNLADIDEAQKTIEAENAENAKLLGRRAPWRQETIQKVLDSVALGLPLGLACDAAYVDRGTFSRWMKNERNRAPAAVLRAAVRSAMARGIEHWLRAMRDPAASNAQARFAEFYLRTRAGDAFAPITKVEHSHTFTVADLVKRATSSPDLISSDADMGFGAGGALDVGLEDGGAGGTQRAERSTPDREVLEVRALPNRNADRGETPTVEVGENPRFQRETGGGGKNPSSSEPLHGDPSPPRDTPMAPRPDPDSGVSPALSVLEARAARARALDVVPTPVRELGPSPASLEFQCSACRRRGPLGIGSWVLAGGAWRCPACHPVGVPHMLGRVSDDAPRIVGGSSEDRRAASPVPVAGETEALAAAAAEIETCGECFGSGGSAECPCGECGGTGEVRA